MSISILIKLDLVLEFDMRRESASSLGALSAGRQRAGSVVATTEAD